jgi:triphosphoribosyl-dephospho-CoA synthase
MGEWDTQKREHDARLAAAARYARGKLVAPAYATALLQSVIRPGAVPERSATHRRVDAVGIADDVRMSLVEELNTWPKPGLVSHVDRGAHDDMDASTFARSIQAITPYFEALARAGAQGATLKKLRAIGLDAEEAMLRATGGINTHRGAIFGLGLLAAAAGRRASGFAEPERSLGDIVVNTWRSDLLHGPTPPGTNGANARRRYGVGGARDEAASGFPSAYEIALPALADGDRLSNGHAEAGRVQAIFALIAALEDTNLLHRGGLAGLLFARGAAAEFLARGGVGRPDWRFAAADLHATFTLRRLSPGGAADLLAISLFLRRMDG